MFMGLSVIRAPTQLFYCIVRFVFTGTSKLLARKLRLAQKARSSNWQEIFMRALSEILVVSLWFSFPWLKSHQVSETREEFKVMAREGSLTPNHSTTPGKEHRA